MHEFECMAKQDERALIFGRPNIQYLAVKAQLRPIQYVAQDWQGSLAEGSSCVIVTHSISLRLLSWTLWVQWVEPKKCQPRR